MTDALALPRVKIRTPGFPALAVGGGIVPVEDHMHPPGAPGWWVELLGGYTPGSPEAKAMRARLSRVYDLDAYLEDELTILKALPGQTARGVLHAHADDGSPISGCRVAYNARGRPDARLDAEIERLNGSRIVRDMGATISGYRLT